MAATLESFFGKKDDLRVPYGRDKKPDSEKCVDVRSDERFTSKSFLPREKWLKAVKLCTKDPVNKSIISGLFANSKENMDKASVKVYTRRVGQEVFWDTKLQRRRTLEELEMDPEICDELSDYKLFQMLKELGGDPEIVLGIGYSDNLRINAENCWDSMELEHPATMLLKLSDDEYAAKYLMMEIDALFSRRDNERIFVFTTNHRDQHDAASLRPVGRDIYINTSSPLPTSLPDGGKRTYQNSLLVSNSKKDNTREAYDSTKGYPLPNFNATENKAVKVYSRRGRAWWNSTEFERLLTFSELGKDPENEGIISDLLSSGPVLPLTTRVGKLNPQSRHHDLKTLLSPSVFASPCFCKVETAIPEKVFSLLKKLFLASTCGRWLDSVVLDISENVQVIEPYDDENLMLSSLFEIIEELLENSLNQQIIVVTTNHNHRDQYHTALLSPLNIDAYMHTSSPQPISLPDGGEIVELDSLEQKPLVDFDATNNRAYQSSVLVSNSEKENTRETSKRQCMTESVFSSDDSRTRKSLTDFVALDYRVNLVRAYQNGPTMFTSDNKDTREGFNGECLTKSVLSDDDLTKREFLPEHTSLTFLDLTSEDTDGFYDSIWVDSNSDSDSDDFDDGAGMLPDLKDEFVDGLSSSCDDERITVSTTNHRDPRDATLLPLVNMDTDIHMASPQLIALPVGGEIMQLESIERKPLVDFDATNNRAYQSSVLVSSKKKNIVEAYKGH
ncbi:hypothetical protein Vadar_026530 [Vaccinium darrowii]|uniref:Uncharacterized protein n=1 Tax=Vaccinium darrowii TaxID=229202 RepID=A0ACB7YGM7_9ERIC|nr:hypothetical protein Vadar_026530 [Vaccinium darrowii]